MIPKKTLEEAQRYLKELEKKQKEQQEEKPNGKES